MTWCRLSRGLSSSAFDALVSYVQWLVTTSARTQAAFAESTFHEDVVRLCAGKIDCLIASSSTSSSGELETALKWSDVALCLCQQAEDYTATQTFLQKKLLLLLNTGNISAAKLVLKDYRKIAKDEVGLPRLSLQNQLVLNLMSNRNQSTYGRRVCLVVPKIW